MFDRGERKIYRGEELKTIGMPCGGIAAGQLYVRGDGIDHLLNFETAQGPWKVCYQTFEPFSYLNRDLRWKSVPAINC